MDRCRLAARLWWEKTFVSMRRHTDRASMSWTNSCSYLRPCWLKISCEQRRTLDSESAVREKGARVIYLVSDGGALLHVKSIC